MSDVSSCKGEAGGVGALGFGNAVGGIVFGDVKIAGCASKIVGRERRRRRRRGKGKAQGRK